MTHELLLIDQKHNQPYGMRHKTKCPKIQFGIEQWGQKQHHIYQVVSASWMDHGKKRKKIQVLDGITLWKVWWTNGAKNKRASLSTLHSEIEALILVTECMRSLRQFHVTFATNYSQLVKMVSKPEKWHVIGIIFGRYQVSKREFQLLGSPTCTKTIKQKKRSAWHGVFRSDCRSSFTWIQSLSLVSKVLVESIILMTIFFKPLILEFSKRDF